MKSLFVILSLTATVAHAKVDTICGTYRIASSDGMLTVMRNLLDVPSGPMTPSFETYELAAAGQTYSEIEDAQAVIESLIEGRNYCITGEVYQKPNYQMVMIPESAQPQP